MLVMFIILIPLILMVLALIVDTANMFISKVKGNGLLETAYKNNYDIEDYFKINGIDIKTIKYNKNDKKCVIINYDIDSIFGELIGLDKYEIKIDNCGEAE